MTETTKGKLDFIECKKCGHFASNHLKFRLRTICVTHQNTVGNCKCEAFVK